MRWCAFRVVWPLTKKHDILAHIYVGTRHHLPIIISQYITFVMMVLIAKGKGLSLNLLLESKFSKNSLQKEKFFPNMYLWHTNCNTSFQVVILWKTTYMFWGWIKEPKEQKQNDKPHILLLDFINKKSNRL
jgi:hypothetical protein